MRVLLQRVSEAQVTVDGETVGAIGPGLLVFLGVKAGDAPDAVEALARKVVGLRIFSDADGRFNHAIGETGGSFLVVSQFTLYADTARGRRPSFSAAAPPDDARALYETFMRRLGELSGRPVAAGRFGAHMRVSLVNDGPVTILIDSEDA